LPADPVAGLAAELSELAGAEVELERPANPTHGDYATNVALRLAGARKQAPGEIAQELAARAAEVEGVERAEVPDEWYAAALEAILGAGETYGASRAAEPMRIQVEMVSANPTGPITVASARNGAYGDSVARLLAFAGHQVEREYYYNDRGAQMERFRASVEARRRGEEPPEDGYRGEYVDELAHLEADPVPVMLEQIERTLERFRVRFDSWALQSELEGRLPEFLSRLDTYERDGAIWARSSAYGDDEDRVVVRSPDQGGPTAARTSSTSPTSSSAASTARSTSSAPTTTARASGTRPSRPCSATTRPASRCCCTSSST